jgi:ATP citrate (pro-S)-lyase
LQFDLGLLEVSKKSFDDHVKSLLNQAEREHPWLKETKLVCKPDQLIKRRGKNGLLGINLNWSQVREWIAKRAGSVIQVFDFDAD